jgi:hypothetical protein
MALYVSPGGTEYPSLNICYGNRTRSACKAASGGEEEERNLEVMNERLHAFLHRRAWWWNKLVIVNFDGARRHLVQALTQGEEGLWFTSRDKTSG